MAEYIKREEAIAIIEEKQKELCPFGRYGRGYVYGSDRDKYDAWDEIIDALENVSNADASPVVHGQWEYIPQTLNTLSQLRCPFCRWWSLDPSIDGVYNYCPNCGAKMDGGADHETD
nr:MAG TPA: DNA-directed RNA polymerase [Caudoviricetes sp.]